MDDILKSFSKKYSSGILVGYEDAEGKKPVRIPVPVSYALAAVDAAGKDWSTRPNWLIGSNRGGRSVYKLDDLMADPTYRDQLQEAMQARGIQYRPLQSKKEGGAPVPKRRSVFPQEDGEDTGVISARAQQTINSRLEKVSGMLTDKEIEEAKTGKLPFRIKQLLEERD